MGLDRSTKAGASTPATHAASSDACSPKQSAQRRPGPRPRQHDRDGRGHEGVAGRSTKAGASTPATPVAVPFDIESTYSAQRRPGPRPRQHPVIVAPLGVAAHAQRRPGPRPRQHAESWTCSKLSMAALNEGRGLDPGNTHGMAIRSPHSGAAQRRPGPRPRQHTRHAIRHGPVRGRSTKAGASTPATHRDGRGHEGVVGRSTKAGASTPATRPHAVFSGA